MGTPGFLGSKVRRLRRERKLTIAELAARVGVTAPTIWSWEKGKTAPRTNKIPALAESLQIAESELILGNGGMKQAESSTTLDEEVARSKARIADLAGTSPDQVDITITW